MFALIKFLELYPPAEKELETRQGCIPWSRLLVLQLTRLIVRRVTPDPHILLPRGSLRILRSASRTEIVRSNSERVFERRDRRGLIHIDTPGININFNGALRRMRNRAMCLRRCVILHTNGGH